MKTTNTTKWIVAFLLVTLLSSGNTAIAQIKIAGDDYSQKLMESKSYYDRNVDFDKYFPAVSPIERFSRMFPSFVDLGYENKYVNLTGDTVYICEEIKRPTNYRSYSFTIKNNVGTEMTVIPPGYYVISGYVFCTEGADSIRIAAGMRSYSDLGYYDDDNGSIRKLKERLFVSGDRFETYELVGYFLNQIALTPLDDDNTIYYVDDQHFDDNVLLLRYYNQLVAFIGKEVVLKKYDGGGLVDMKMVRKVEIIKDGITGDLVKLDDEKFEVVDAVLRDCRFYIVLKGEKTGTFALKANSIYFTYSSKEIVKVAQDQRPSDWSIIVKKYNNMMDIPVLKVGYDKRADYYDNEIALIIEENNWKTIEARAKKMNEQVKEELKLQQQRDQKEKENKEAEYKKHMIAKYGSPFGEFVANKQVAVGMTKEMCRDAWGAPINTYRTTTSLGQSEVWCYDYKTRVYFYGNKVTRIED